MEFIRKDLTEKFVLLSGPRQVGKTTLALGLLIPPSKSHPAYLNWDIPRSKRLIQKSVLPPNEKLIVFDEIHKYSRWRNSLKGIFDEYHPRLQVLVTGSARLDHYRRGGDSMLGRYHHHRLHPFSLSEIGGGRSNFDQLLKFSGFPEPLSSASETRWRRWQSERFERVLQEDVRDLETLRDISLLDVLMEALPERIGSPLSIQSLREDLEVAHDTVRRWLDIFENLYVCFRISPWGPSKIRSVKKEKKLYLWDWSAIEKPGPRFENLVASQLLKFCHLKSDTEGHKMELAYLRDIDKREVDFVVLKNKAPLFAVECKLGEKTLSPHIQYFADRTSIPKFYQVHTGETHLRANSKAEILPFVKFCDELEMP